MRKYNSYTAKFKVKVIKFTELNGNRTAQRESFVNEAHTHYWCKQKESQYEAKGSVRTFLGPKIGKFPELADKLFKYFEETRNNGNAVSHEMLQL
jgi:hypothetical protein